MAVASHNHPAVVLLQLAPGRRAGCYGRDLFGRPSRGHFLGGVDVRPLAHRRPVLAIVAGFAVLAATAPLTPGGATAPARASATGAAAPPSVVVASAPTTKIKHVVVLFGENISYDHYFGTYPQATNRNGVKFHPRK